MTTITFDVASQEIGKQLPKYMLPHIFVYIENMPLTASGKINRKALPEVDLSNIISGVEYIAPVTETQRILCTLAEEVLGVSPVGLADNFFDLGGDSLEAIEFVSKAHHAGIYFSLQGMYNTSTMEELAEYIENGDKETFSLDDMDFTAANRILARNKIEHITMPRETDVGNLLLTGATGFLGAHILADYLDNDSGVAYCLVRGQDDADAERRLADRLRFYFGDKYAASSRIRAIRADLEKLRFGLDEEKYEMLQTNVTTVINAAASVKHYGSYEFFYQANVETVKRLIAFCMDSDTRLIHISTTGVSGRIPEDGKKAEVSFSESDLYIGQSLDNVYARSKFEAEKAVLDAMNEGLSANILRMGNLTNRYSDGMFQPNYETNDFLKHIRAILALAVYPDYLQDHVVEFTPIDEAAHAVTLIARHFSTEQTVFHIENNRVIYIRDVCRYFTKLGFPVVATDGETFAKLLHDSASQPDKAYIHETFINDMDERDRLNYGSIHLDTDFTVRYLSQLGFKWSEIELDYLRRYVEYFKTIGYLEDGNNA